MDLSGKVAVVTGGTKGIGRAIVDGLRDAGASVVFSARTGTDVERTGAELGEGALGVVADVRKADDCARLMEEAVARFGGLDILVNNAGVGRFDPVESLSVEQWDQVIETNLNGPFYCAHAAIPHLKRRGGGWIINIGSLAGKNAFPGGAAYNASKFGLIGFSEAMMQEVRYDGIRVSTIMPGSVSTDNFSSGAADWKIQPADVSRIVLDLLAMPDRTLPSRIEVRPSRPPRK
ncbi:MAG TPA: SDR family oxidoreductase [Longimicrobiales bacterium]|nr:SDR family oxidoreductase [Longimicrobiales bacterium]